MLESLAVHVLILKCIHSRFVFSIDQGQVIVLESSIAISTTPGNPLSTRNKVDRIAIFLINSPNERIRNPTKSVYPSIG